MNPISPAAMRLFPCFRDFTEAELSAAAAHLRPVTLAAGATLFKQGETGDAVYFLATGQIDIVVAVDGQVDHTFLLEAGATFGEVAPLLGHTRTAAAVARGAAELWCLPWAALRAGLDGGTSWAVKLLLATAQVLATRLIGLDRQMAIELNEMRRKSAKPPRVAELEALRKRLATEWAF